MICYAPNTLGTYLEILECAMHCGNDITSILLIKTLSGLSPISLLLVAHEHMRILFHNLLQVITRRLIMGFCQYTKNKIRAYLSVLFLCILIFSVFCRYIFRIDSVFDSVILVYLLVNDFVSYRFNEEFQNEQNITS